MRLHQINLFRLLFIMLLGIGLATGCSSDQQGQQDDDLEESDQQEAAEAEDQQQDEDEYGEEGEDGDLSEINELSQQTTMTEDGNDAGGMDSMGINNLNNMNNLNDLSDGISDLGGEQENNGGDQMANMGNMGMEEGGGGEAAVVVPPPPADNSGRVVRFVLSNDTPVFGQPDAGATAIATMFQGDAVVVAVNGEWAQINEGRYIMSSALSTAIVPRSRPLVDWTPPAQSVAGP